MSPLSSPRTGRSLVLLALSLLAPPVSVAAQSIDACSRPGFHGDPTLMYLLAAPDILAGTADPGDYEYHDDDYKDYSDPVYEVVAAGGAGDGSDPNGSLGGLKGFDLPAPGAGDWLRGAWSYDRYAQELNRYQWSPPSSGNDGGRPLRPRGEQGGGVKPPEGPELPPGGVVSRQINMDLPDELKHGFGEAWCGRGSSQGFYFRGAAVQDFRWDVKTVPEVVICKASSFGLKDCGPEYAGIPILTSSLLPGPGFPTVRHRIPPPRDQEARRAADQLYKDLEQNKLNTMSASVYHLEISKAQIWRYNIPEDQVPHDDECSSWWDFLPFFSSDKCADFKYRRSLSGRVRRYTFHDPRVGVQPDSSGGTWMEYDIRLRGSPIYFKKWEEMTKIEDAVQDVCGHKDGCQLLGPRAPGPARGIVDFPGGDDSLRTVQMCRAIAEDNAQLGGPESCDDMKDNPFMEGMNPTDEELRAMGTERGDFGGSGPPTLSEEDIARQRTGVRTVGGTEVQAPSQHRRVCLKIMAEDSIRQVNGPVPLGTDRSSIIYEPTDRVPEPCLRYRKDQG